MTKVILKRCEFCGVVDCADLEVRHFGRSFTGVTKGLCYAACEKCFKPNLYKALGLGPVYPSGKIPEGVKLWESK